jgi:soluble lytic murein transglycosylase-like protein
VALAGGAMSFALRSAADMFCTGTGTFRSSSWLRSALLAVAVLPGAAPLAFAQKEVADSANPKKGVFKIYKSEQNGTTAFSDMVPRTGAYLVYRTYCYACKLTSNVDWNATGLHLSEYEDEIKQAALQFALEPALVRAVIHAESGFNAKALSPKGAMGLMQLMPDTARMLGVKTAYRPDQNILGGSRYLASLLVRFKNDVTLAIAAYNAGPEAVRKHAGIPPYAETRVYVQRVKILYQRYKDQEGK